MAPIGFWSYVHADDEAEEGRITRLARDVVAQYELITGEVIEVFLDKDAIEWGENWRGRIDDSLASVVFFVPIITPRYFSSAECRRELQFFARRATALGVKELIMPLVYVRIPGLSDDLPADEAVSLVKQFQWEDWTVLRFADPHSGEYRKAVACLAERLVRANEHVQQVDLAGAAEDLVQSGMSDGDEDETPGFLDQVAKAEEDLPKWSDTMLVIGEQIEEIGVVMQQATEEMAKGDAQGKGFAARLTIAKILAHQLRQPAERIVSFGSEFTSYLHSVDTGIRALISRAPVEVEEDAAAEEQVCQFFDMVRQLAGSAHEGLGSLQQMVDAIDGIQGMSRDLRPSLRALRKGLTVMIEGREVSDEWVKLIDASPVNCGATPS